MPWPPAQPPRGPARWPIVVMFVITLVAVAAAVAAWLRPMPEAKSPAPSAPTFTAQQVADAKSEVCAAYQKVRRASDANANRKGGDDPTSQLAVAVNDRQIYEAGSAYLLTRLSDEPATPPDLATAVGKLARLFQTITLNFLASDPSMPERDAGDRATSTIQNLCK
jgi:hypothetical protein